MLQILYFHPIVFIFSWKLSNYTIGCLPVCLFVGRLFGWLVGCSDDSLFAGLQAGHMKCKWANGDESLTEWMWICSEL